MKRNNGFTNLSPCLGFNRKVFYEGSIKMVTSKELHSNHSVFSQENQPVLEVLI